jgi:type IV pilus biogenesis protein CpaD/CtpE
VTGWEIRQALRVILAHADGPILTALAWLDAEDRQRLSGLLRRTEDRSRKVTDVQLPDIGPPHPANG